MTSTHDITDLVKLHRMSVYAFGTIKGRASQLVFWGSVQKASLGNITLERKLLALQLKS